MGTLEHGPLFAPIIHHALKLDFGFPLGLLGSSLEHHDFVLVRGILVQLLLERLFDPLVDLNVTGRRQCRKGQRG